MTRSGLKVIHLVVGVFGLVAFLGTGQFMDRRLGHLAGMADAPRALYRSAHIYLLFAALINVALGVYVDRLTSSVGRGTQYVGSALLVASLALLLFGFFVEAPPGLLDRPLTSWGIYASLAGVLLHGVSVPLARKVGTPARP